MCKINDLEIWWNPLTNINLLERRTGGRWRRTTNTRAMTIALLCSGTNQSYKPERYNAILMKGHGCLSNGWLQMSILCAVIMWWSFQRASCPFYAAWFSCNVFLVYQTTLTVRYVSLLVHIQRFARDGSVQVHGPCSEHGIARLISLPPTICISDITDLCPAGVRR